MSAKQLSPCLRALLPSHGMSRSWSSTQNTKSSASSPQRSFAHGTRLRSSHPLSLLPANTWMLSIPSPGTARILSPKMQCGLISVDGAISSSSSPHLRPSHALFLCFLPLNQVPASQECRNDFRLVPSPAYQLRASITPLSRSPSVKAFRPHHHWSLIPIHSIYSSSNLKTWRAFRSPSKVASMLTA